MQHAAFPIWLVPALAGMAIPLILVPAALLAKRSRLNRQLTHKERMEAIRMGVTLPSRPSTPGAGSLVAIGAGVPIAAVLMAWLTAERIPYVTPEYGVDSLFVVLGIWGCAALISGFALTVTLILGLLQHRARARTEKLEREASAFASAKPAHDPDAFDLTGRHAY